jgi:VWFA-related protein
MTVVGVWVAATAAATTDGSSPTLRPDHAAWLEEAALLITAEERTAFAALEKDYQREAFIQRFWQVRDPFPDTARNEFRDQWQERVALARERFDDLGEDRARMLLLNGPPAETRRPLCRSGVKALEIWYYPNGTERVREGFTLVFVAISGGRGGRYRLWRPSDGLLAIVDPSISAATGAAPPTGPDGLRGAALRTLLDECSEGGDILEALGAAADWERLESRVELVPEPSPEWLRTFAARSTEVPDGAAALDASLELRFPGRQQSRTVVESIVLVPVETPAVARSFLVDGEVLLKGELFDHFRYRFDLAAAQGSSGSLPLIVQRLLRPGEYELILRVEELASHRFYRVQRSLDVPLLERVGPAAAETAAAAAPAAAPPPPAVPALAEATAALPSSDHSIKVFAPGASLSTGRLRVEAETTGDGVARVEFALNGRRVLSKSRPPWSVEIDLGRAPRTHRLSAVARDGNGQVLASDEVLVNAGPHRFRLRLVQPQRGHRYTASLRAEAEVDVPAGETLDRVEFFLNETRVATLFQPPFVQPILLPQDGAAPVSYVRAVAYLDDGNATEDVVFVNAPDHLEEMRVAMVELYATVVDRRGRPVEDVAVDDFVVTEDGKPQQIVRFERVRDLPIHAGIVLDTSASMLEELDETVRAALRFFETVIEPRDRAAIVTFADKPQLVVPFTNNPAVLAGGVGSLVADGETALWDSLVFALHYFSGLRSKRALIVLTDGADTMSRYQFSEALEFARRAGVALYPIGLRLSQRDFEARSKLQQLAAETGGRAYMIEGAGGLARVYEEIERELRAQFLLVYQSPHTEGDGYREVEVQLTRPGLEVKTIRGYFP